MVSNSEKEIDKLLNEHKNTTQQNLFKEIEQTFEHHPYQYPEQLIDQAIKTLQPHLKFSDDDQCHQNAVALFKVNLNKYCQLVPQKNRSPVDIANIALLGVLCVYTTGAIRPIIQVNRGNLLLVPPQDGYENSSDAIVDQANRIDFTWNDTLGLEAKAIYTEIKRAGGDLQPDLLEKYIREGYIPLSNSIGSPTDQPIEEPTENQSHPIPRLIPPTGEL